MNFSCWQFKGHTTPIHNEETVHIPSKSRNEHKVEPSIDEVELVKGG